MGRNAVLLATTLGALALVAVLRTSSRAPDAAKLRRPAQGVANPAEPEAPGEPIAAPGVRPRVAPLRDEASSPSGSHAQPASDRGGIELDPRPDAVPASVSGRVLGSLGGAVADAEICVLGPTSGREELGPSTRTNAAGAFTLELAPGHSRLVARATGAAASRPFRLQLDAGQSLEGVALVLRESGALEIDVLNRNGLRPEWAELRVDSSSEEDRHETNRTVLPARFADLPPGMVEVAAQFDDGTAGTRTLVAIAEIRAGEITKLILGGPLERPVRVYGRVLSRTGPLSGVEITFVRSDADGSSAESSGTTSGESGDYELVVDGGGSYDVLLHAATGRSSSNQQVEIPDGHDEIALDIELPGGSIEGTVRDVNGEPAGNTFVRAEPDRRTADLSATFSYDFTETDDEGHYRLEGLHAGSYEIVAGNLERSGTVGSAAVELVEGQAIAHLDLVLLSAQGSVTGRVIDVAGRPVAEARVDLLRPADSLLPGSSRVTDAEGRFELATDGTPGVAFVAARTIERAAPLAGPLVLGPRSRSGSGDDLELVLSPGGQLVVSVREADGRAVGAALRVLLEGVDVGAVTRRTGAADDAQRSQRFGPLPPGTYEVVAENHDRVRASKTVRVLAGEESVIELVLGG